MTHQELITTPDIDLINAAESTPSKEILDELASRGTATVFEWLRSRGHWEYSETCDYAARQNRAGTLPLNFGTL